MPTLFNNIWEAVLDAEDHQNGDDVTTFHFGSQSEGTITPGLQYDMDMLKS